MCLFHGTPICKLGGNERLREVPPERRLHYYHPFLSRLCIVGRVIFSLSKRTRFITCRMLCQNKRKTFKTILGCNSHEPILFQGTRDWPPEVMRQRSWLFDKFRTVARQFAFDEYDAPILEEESLYKRKAGRRGFQLLFLFLRFERNFNSSIGKVSSEAFYCCV